MNDNPIWSKPVADLVCNKCGYHYEVFFIEGIPQVATLLADHIQRELCQNA